LVVDFNIYELLYTIGIIAGMISFIGGLFSDSCKTTGVFIITLLLSAMLMIYGGHSKP